MLLVSAIAYARRKQYEGITLKSVPGATAFYEKHGFVRSGDVVKQGDDDYPDLQPMVLAFSNSNKRSRLA